MKAEEVAKKIQKTKDFDDFEQSKPVQLTLFEIFQTEEVETANQGAKNKVLEKRSRLSHLVALYDQMPKFFWGKNPKRIDGRFLEILEREFEYKGKKYELKISPARIKDKDGVSRDYYPGRLEESIEAVLRKLACEGQGIFLDNQAAVTFSLYEIQNELARHGQSHSIDEIKHSLRICSRSILTLVSSDQTVDEIDAPMFPALGLRTKDKWKESGKKAQAFVSFYPLVTEAIKTREFRIFNYEKSMKLSKAISRQLHKRMSYVYRQASFTNLYHINLTTMIRDFGLTTYDDLRKNLEQVIISLDEMKLKRIILSYKIDETIDARKRNKLLDATITITPDNEFIEDVIEANKHDKYVEAMSRERKLLD